MKQKRKNFYWMMYVNLNGSETNLYVIQNNNLFRLSSMRMRMNTKPNGKQKRNEDRKRYFYVKSKQVRADRQ